jgi:outer membrane lipoprotein carrier protein
MNRIASTCGLAILLLSGSLSAQDATDRLLEALSGMQQLTGSFQQRQYAENDVLVLESRGRFRLLRPGYFSWEIEAPGRQLIIADPSSLWHYDRDLETVTRRPVNSGASMSPLQVLGGDASALRENYNVTEEGGGVFTLEPAGVDPGFRQLSVKLRAFLIERMEIIDNLNHTVVIEFADLDVDAGLTSEDFAFRPPEGVDTFYYDK